MAIQRWTTDFKLNASSTLSPAWINLPDLLWYYYEWAALCRIVEPIGNPIVIDKATQSKTRPSTAKLRVEIDLLKPLLTNIQVVIKNFEGQVDTFNQKIEYKTLPTFCQFCRTQDHSQEKCKRTILDPQEGNQINRQADYEKHQSQIEIIKEYQPNKREMQAIHMEATISGSNKQGPVQQGKEQRLMNTAVNMEDVENTRTEAWQNVENKKNKGKINDKRFVSSTSSGHNVDKKNTTGVNICDKQNSNAFNKLTDLDMEITISEAENTRWDKAQATKTKERQSEKTIRHRHNFRIRHTIKNNQTSQENVVKHVQENVECSKPNVGNPIKNLLGEKQRFERKITIPTGVFLEGEGQHNKVDKTVAWIPFNLPSGATHTEDDNIREKVLEPDPPNAIKEQSQIMTLGDKPKQPQEMTKKYYEDDMETSISDDELTRGSTSGKQTENESQ
ncbi:hypothetical protein KY285_000497 [Solanum tuberosum]|nr:hypothetical protein KY285_000497 [Solanum tuberosum]